MKTIQIEKEHIWKKSREEIYFPWPSVRVLDMLLLALELL